MTTGELKKFKDMFILVIKKVKDKSQTEPKNLQRESGEKASALPFLVFHKFLSGCASISDEEATASPGTRPI